MKHWLVIIFILLLTISLGCSRGGDIPTSPLNASPREAASGGSHLLWGFWQCTADPGAETLQFVPIRGADMHLNALVFLEPPPLVNLTVESLKFNGDVIDADIGLRHPFLGLDEFTGFDVCGLLISKGSIDGFTDSGIVIPGADDVQLLNADGYSRWWNPTEFPLNNGSIFSYQDGLLGTPQSIGQFNATVNAYKYFCADFTDPDDPMSIVDPTKRGVFPAGEKVVRHYSIKMGAAGLVFNYAIDASWQFPAGPKPWDVPGDFPPGANRPEAWWLDAQVTGSNLYNDGTVSGGDLSLRVDLYDWYNIELNTVNIESPGNFPPATDLAPTGGGEGYSTYEVEIKNTSPAYGEIRVLVIAESEANGFGGFLPGKSTAAYQMLTVPVSPESEPLEAIGTVTIDPYFDGFGPRGTASEPIPLDWYLTLDASASTGPITDFLWEMNGDDLFDDASGMIVSTGFPDTGTHIIKLKVKSNLGDDVLVFPDSYAVVGNSTFVWAAFTGTSDGTRANPWKAIASALVAVGTDGYILVRGDDGAGGQCTYSYNLLLTSTNAGCRIQGYYGDYDTDEPPMMTGYVRVEGDDITFDGFEVTGPSSIGYWPGGSHHGKLGNIGGENVLFRHIYIHDIEHPTDLCKAILCFGSGSLTAQNILEVDIKCSYLSNQVLKVLTEPGDPSLTFLNCTMDRLGFDGNPGAAYYISGGNGEVYNSIWTDCNAAGAAYFRRGNLTYTTSNVDYTDTFDTPIPPDGAIYYSLVTKGPNCIEGDPLYADTYTDHHLQAGSPCIDKGDPGIADYDGSISDMGCYGGPDGDWDFEK